MSALKAYTHRESADAVLPRDILDAVGVPTWVRQARLVVFARTATSAARHLKRIGILATDNPRQLSLAHGNDIRSVIVRSLIADAVPEALTVLCWSTAGGDKVVVNVDWSSPRRIVTRVGEFRGDVYYPDRVITASIEVTDAMVDAAFEAIDIPRDIPVGWLVRDMRAAIAAALQVQQAQRTVTL